MLPDTAVTNYSDSQYLVDNNYAGPGKVIINGGSNGGG
jgi:prolyl oligopeptidase PreP (S9A serine peptidase family)